MVDWIIISVTFFAIVGGGIIWDIITKEPSEREVYRKVEEGTQTTKKQLDEDETNYAED